MASALDKGGGLADVIEYQHDLPGRLRVRSSLFRRNPDRATAIKNSLESAEGVRSVAVNVVTGSVTVYYDRHRTSSGALLEIFRCHGGSMSTATLPHPPY